MKASKMIELAKSYLGYNEEDGSHQVIIDLYNQCDHLPVDYQVKYTDHWCATFVSALAIQLDYDDFPIECSCPRMIKELKLMNCWVEEDYYYPHPGDLIFYDWQDSGKGDNKGEADHVGIIEKVIGNKIYVIEGNYHHKVDRRIMEVNGRYIRGFGKLIYEQESQIGDIIEFDQYLYRSEIVNAYARGVIVYITKNYYVVDLNDDIVFVEKI